MNNLYDILNIRKIDIEKTIQESIADTNKELDNLETDRTCLIYTSYLYKNLKKRNVLAYMVDTMEDLGYEYEHRFIIVPVDIEHNYVLDLTVSQFGKNKVFEKMVVDGYQLLNRGDFALYVEHVANKKVKRK